MKFSSYFVLSFLKEGFQRSPFFFLQGLWIVLQISDIKKKVWWRLNRSTKSLAAFLVYLLTWRIFLFPPITLILSHKSLSFPLLPIWVIAFCHCLVLGATEHGNFRPSVKRWLKRDGSKLPYGLKCLGKMGGQNW